LLAIAGQIGGKPPKMELPRGFSAQFTQALHNVVAVVQAAGGQPTDVISLTIFVTDQRQYHAATEEVGKAWQEIFGKHYPAMALVEVKGLIDAEAVVEMQALAAIP
jgi:enamine deaminase RidA (YjgF/YER057c/UK114 family)